MTKALPFTEHSLQRAIRAARKAGLRVTGIRPDGSLVVNDGDSPAEPIETPTAPEQDAETSRWSEVKA